MNQAIINKIIQSPDILKKTITQYPGIYSSFITIKQNVSSDITSKSFDKIIKFYETNKGFKEFIDSLNLESIEQDENDVSGTVLVIDKNEESYKKIIETANREHWKYKGIAIVSDFDSLRLYFY